MLVQDVVFNGGEPRMGSTIEHEGIVGTACVGIEIELENMNVRRWSEGFRDLWRIIEDHSLRSTTGASLEMVIDGTVNTKAIMDSLELAYSHIGAQNISSRTALHVHLNVTDLTVGQLKDLLVLYVTLEEFFDAVGGGVRAFNNFSLGTKYSHRLLDLIGHIYHSDDASVGRVIANSGPSQNYRYAGINIGSIINLGSLEFRNRCTPERMEDALLWVNLILSLREYVVSFGNERIPFQELFAMLSGDVVRGMIKEVFHHSAVRGYVGEFINHVDFFGSMRRAQTVLMHNDTNQISNDFLNSLGA